MNNDRSKAGKKVAIVAIGANCILTIFNIAIGIMSGSYALVSEGAHTLSDVGTSIIAYIGFNIGQKPADDEHPYGHGRAEAICGLVIVIFLFIVAYEIITGAIEKLLHPTLITQPTAFAAIMAFFGIVINLSISQYIINVGKQIKSPSIVADGQHQRTDIYSSVAVLLSVVISNMGFPILDPIMGLIIGGLILKTAYGIVKENLDYILGKVPKEYVENIRRISNSVDGVYETHEIKINYIGPYSTVSMHIKLDGNMTLYESHEITHKVQDKIMKEIPEIQYIVVHACPLGINYEHEQEIDKK